MKRAFKRASACLSAAFLSLSANAGASANIYNAGSARSVFYDSAGAAKKQYASHSETLNEHGGTFTLPAYGGFSGNVSYGFASPQKAKLIVSNAGTNNPFGAPKPAVGTPVLYLRFAAKTMHNVVLGSYVLTISSKALESGINYALDIFVDGAQEATGITQVVSNGQTSLSFPLVASISPADPVDLELVPLPQATLLDANNDYSSGGVYFRNANVPGEPTNFFAVPNAMAVGVDDSSNIYAAGDVGGGSVAYEYLANGGGPIAYYNDQFEFIRLAAGAGNNAQLDVANVANLLSYPQGSNSPLIFDDPFGTLVQAVAVDGASNGYIGGQSQRGPEVDFLETNVGSFDLGLNLAYLPRALAIDASGNLAVAECGGTAGAIQVFAPGTTNPLFSLIAGCEIDLAFGNSGTWLYALGPNGEVQLYNYSGNFTYGIHTFPLDVNANGIAIDPRLPLFTPDSYKRAHPGFRYWTDFKYPRHAFARARHK